MKKLPKIKYGDILRQKDGKIEIGGQSLSQEEIRILKEEALYIERTRLWSILTNTLADDARQVMFEKSKDFEDMRTGKAILYAIDIQEKIINKFKTLVAK